VASEGPPYLHRKVCGIVSRMGTSGSAPGTWRVSDGDAVAFNEAKAEWAQAGRRVLIQTAMRYHDIITYGELAEQVQILTGIRTKSQMRNWIGSVLGMVADECVRRNEPPLTSLCVHQDGSVGEGYVYVVRLQQSNVPEDLDQHAADARLDCYRFFGATIPADGGSPALTPQVAARRRAARRDNRPAQVCPRCFLVLPATGVCDSCSQR
jgi:hypothetical protein